MLLLLTSALADCTPEVLRSNMNQADAAIAELDIDRLGTAATAMVRTLECLRSPVQIDDAATVHRIRGIQSFVTGATAEADRWFAASRALDPSTSLGHAIGGPLQAAWDRASASSMPERSDVAAARRGTLFIDGQPLNSHPTHLPWVFQHVDGPSVTTALITSGTPVPRYPGDQPPPREDDKRRRGKPLTIVAVAALALGGAAVGGAGWTRLRHNDPTVSNQDAAKLVSTNRALGIGGFVLTGIGVGLGTTALIAGEW